MFEFAFTTDLGVAPLEAGAATMPSVEGAQLVSAFTPEATFATTRQFSPEVVEKFQAAMAKPLKDNAILQQALETIVSEKQIVVSEKQVVQVEAPVLATENTKITEKPVVSDRAQDTGIAKPETTIVEKPVVADKKAVAIEQPVVADKPAVVVPETPKASESAVNFVAKELPVATPETFKAAIVENKEVAKVFESVVSDKPVVIVSEKQVVQVDAPISATENTKVPEKPVVTDRAQDTAIVKPETTIVEKPVVTDKPAVVVEQPVVMDKPAVVIPETPKASAPSVNFVAKELPVATPETFEAAIVENKEVAKVFESVVSDKPVVIVSEKLVVQVEAPVTATENTKVTENTTTVVTDKPAVVVSETPKASESSVNYVAKEFAIEKPVVADKSAVVVEKPVMTEEKRPEEVVITAMPNAIPEATVQPIAVPEINVAPIVSVSVEAKVEAVTAAEVLVQAATAVADTMLVSPGLMRGEGEIIIHLKQDVLSGTELKIAVQAGTMTVEFAPTVEKIATLLQQNQGSLVQVLSERVGRFNIVVNVRPTHEKGSRYARA